MGERRGGVEGTGVQWRTNSKKENQIYAVLVERRALIAIIGK